MDCQLKTAAYQRSLMERLETTKASQPVSPRCLGLHATGQHIFNYFLSPSRYLVVSTRMDQVMHFEILILWSGEMGLRMDMWANYSFTAPAGTARNIIWSQRCRTYATTEF